VCQRHSAPLLAKLSRREQEARVSPAESAFFAYASSQGAGNKDCSALTHRHSHRSFSRRETNASRLTPLSKGGGNPCTEVAPEGNKDCSAASPRRCLAQRRDKIIFMQEVYSKVNSRGFPDAIKKNLYKTFLYKSVPSSRVLFR
jgi:hypothetical protein